MNKNSIIIVSMVLLLAANIKATEVSNPSWLTDILCDATTECPDGFTCVKFPGMQAKCAKENPCSYYDCGENYQCSVAESYPPQVVCSPIEIRCTDSDGGSDYYEKGTVKENVNNKDYTDFCFNDKELNEYYCTKEGSVGGIQYPCPNGCKDGACLKEEVCTAEYNPVCGEVQVQCIKAPCYPIKQTFSNKCELEKAGAKFLYYGKCQEDVVREQVKCIFSGSNKEQECSSEFGSCKGIGSCIVDVKGEKGEKITWKSSCGGYAYTVIDGQNEYAEFSCTQDKECKAVFSSCSCSYQCMEISPNEARTDCKRLCSEDETISYMPDCGYRNGVCLDLNERPECKKYQDEKGCTITTCSDGTETIECPSVPSGKYVKLNEKFGLVDEQSAKVTDYGYMKLTLRNWMCTGACPEGAPCKVSCAISLQVEMPSECEKSASTTSCAITGKDLTLSEGQSEEAFGAKITYLDKREQEAILIVQKPITIEGGVDIEISPNEQTIGYGEKAVYKVTVADKHSEAGIICAPGFVCDKPFYTYFIDVRNLPFLKEYPKQIELSAGESKTFELIVRPYVIEAEESTKLVSVSQSSSGGSATTGYAIAKPTKVESSSIPVKIEETVATESPIEIKPSVAALYKTYKFDIRAMQKNDPNNQDFAYAVLNIKPKEPPMPRPPEFPGEDIKIKLYKGWNLISLPGKLVKFEKIELERKLIGFVYLKEEQKYVTLKDAQEILGDRFREYLARNAFWVYSYEDIGLKVKIDREISYNDIDLKKGWNLAPITEDMLGGYLSDIKGDCEFEKLYLWDAAGQKWEKIDESYHFSDNLLNYGFLIKAKEDCRLGGAIIALTPPEMPN